MDLVEEYLLEVTGLADEATELSLEYYAELKPSSLYVPEPFVDPSLEARLRNTADFALSDRSPETSSVLQGAGLRAIRDQGRSTLIANADAEKGRWFRAASADSCGFCRMLTIRGPVYRSEHAAAASHNGCNCKVAVVRPGMSYTRPKYMAGWNDEYERAKELTSARGEQHSLKNVVREWNRIIKAEDKGLDSPGLDKIMLHAA